MCLPALAGTDVGMWFVTEQCGCKVRQVLPFTALFSLAGGQTGWAQLILWLQRGQGSNLNYFSPFQNDRVTWSRLTASQVTASSPCCLPCPFALQWLQPLCLPLVSLTFVFSSQDTPSH